MFCAIGCRCALPVATAAERPNLVIFVADDLGFNDVGYHGSEIRTPNIDRLVAEGVELDRFYSFPVCSPTRAALMTGRLPLRFGITGPLRPRDDGLPLDEHLLPQTFRAAGYQTLMVGKWHLGASDDDHLPHHRGFDHFYGFVNGFIDYYTHESRESGRPDWQRNGKPLNEPGYSTDLFAAEAVRLLRGRDKTKPVLLYLALNAPHSPLQAPEPLIEKYRAIEHPGRRVFAAMVEAMDTAIGRVLATIDEQGMKQNTLVVFFSDNGGASRGAASNQPLMGGKGSVFEGGIRVPAVIRWPGVLEAGRKSRQVIAVQDLFPTLAAAMAVQPRNSKPFDGRNLWPAIRDGKNIPPENVVIGAGGNCAVLHGRWKLVQLGLTTDGAPQTYLIDIEKDPREKWDLSAEHPELVRELAARIAPWTESLRAGRGPGSGRPGRRGRRRGP